MAKQKKKKLYCDEVADSNIRLITKIGKVVTADELFPIIADDYTTQTASKRESVTIEQLNDKLSTRAMSNMANLTAVNNWYWGGRQVYRFDSELAELLRSQSKDDVSIDIEALNLLPVQHFFISLGDDNSYGFFVSLSGGVIYISDMLKDHTEAYVLPIPSCNSMISDIIENVNKTYGNVSKKEAAELAKRMTVYMQFVIYLSAVNAEIQPATKGAVITRQAGQKPVTRHDKTEISEVGYRLGEAIRASRKEKTTVKYVGEHTQGSPKSPHIRRSHFHSYWTGSGEEKTLIVKWINSIFVNGNKDAVNVSTVHDVIDK